MIHARDGTAAVLRKLEQHSGAVMISALSLAELRRGSHHAPHSQPLRRARLERLLDSVPVVPFDAAAANAYGQIIAVRGWVRGRDFDRMIAAHAISTGSILVTNNEIDFRDIPGLTLENWVTA